jgi:hypothetical protein
MHPSEASDMGETAQPGFSKSAWQHERISIRKRRRHAENGRSRMPFGVALIAANHTRKSWVNADNVIRYQR